MSGKYREKKQKRYFKKYIFIIEILILKLHFIYFQILQKEKKIDVPILSFKRILLKKSNCEADSLWNFLQTYFMFVRYKFLHSVFNYDETSCIEVVLINIAEREKEKFCYLTKRLTRIFHLSFIVYAKRFITVQENHKNFPAK